MSIDCYAEDDDLFWNMMIEDSVIMGWFEGLGLWLIKECNTCLAMGFDFNIIISYSLQEAKTLVTGIMIN